MIFVILSLFFRILYSLCNIIGVFFWDGRFLGRKSTFSTEKSRSMIDKLLSILRIQYLCGFADLASQAPTDILGALGLFSVGLLLYTPIFYCCCTLPIRNWNLVGFVDFDDFTKVVVDELYLTYKELKLFGFAKDTNPFLYSSCTLPIRNWNESGNFRGELKAVVGLYLTYKDL